MRRKHIPQRTCVGCREVLPKRSLIRIVRTPTGIQVDSTGKLAGRGAYIHDQRTCWEHSLKGALAAALKKELAMAEMEMLLDFLATLPVDQASSASNMAAQPD